MKIEDIQVGMWVRNYGLWCQVIGTRRKVETTNLIDRDGETVTDTVTLTVKDKYGSLSFPQHQAGDDVEARTEEPQ